MKNKERTQALDSAMSQIERQFGKGSIMRLGSTACQKIAHIDDKRARNGLRNDPVALVVLHLKASDLVLTEHGQNPEIRVWRHAEDVRTECLRLRRIVGQRSAAERP